MPTYKITSPDGRVFRVKGDSPPTENELNDIYSGMAEKTPSSDMPTSSSAAEQQAQPREQMPSRLRNDVTFLGSERLGKTASALFPRTAKMAAEGKSSGLQETLGAGADIMTLPFRGAASTIDPKERGLESVADITGEGKGFLQQLIRPVETAASVYTLPISGPLAGAKGAAMLGPKIMGAASKAAPFVERFAPALMAKAAGGASKFTKFADLISRTAPAVSAGALEGTTAGVAREGEEYAAGRGVSGGRLASNIGIGAAIPVAAPAILRPVNKALGSMAGALSGVGEKTLRKWGFGLGKGAKEITEAQTGAEVRATIKEMADNVGETITEKKVVDEALKKTPELSILPAIQELQAAKKALIEGKKNLGPYREAINEKIDDAINDLKDRAPGSKQNKFFKQKYSATAFKQMREDLDKRAIFDMEVSGDVKKYVNDAIVRARTKMKDQLINASPAEYKTAMQEWSRKLQLKDDLSDIIRSNDFENDVALRNRISRSTEAQKAIKDLGDLYGEDLLGKIELSKMAEELGPGRTPTILPRQSTGRSTLGGEIGRTVGPAAATLGTGALLGPAAAAVPLALSSPKVASKVLSLADLIEKFGVGAGRKGRIPIGIGIRSQNGGGQ